MVGLHSGDGVTHQPACTHAGSATARRLRKADAAGVIVRAAGYVAMALACVLFVGSLDDGWVHVGGYYRSNGTYVEPYVRHYPGMELHNHALHDIGSGPFAWALVAATGIVIAGSLLSRGARWGLRRVGAWPPAESGAESLPTLPTGEPARRPTAAHPLPQRPHRQRHHGPLPCPRCGRVMVLRRGRASGAAFWGCTGYPGCRGTRRL